MKLILAMFLCLTLSSMSFADVFESPLTAERSKELAQVLSAASTRLVTSRQVVIIIGRVRKFAQPLKKRVITYS
jgi:hypothetical protein